MSPRTWRVIASISVLLVFGAGLAFALTRSPDYRSAGALVLAPAVSDATDKAQLLQTYERSGTIGTFVQLVASADTFSRAGRPPVTIDVRAIPDARVIQVSAEGSRDSVQTGLRAVMASAAASQGTLSDLWDLRVLESASRPEQAGPGLAVLVMGAALLALLGGVLTYVVLWRLAVADRARMAPEDFEFPAAEDEPFERYAGSSRR